MKQYSEKPESIPWASSEASPPGLHLPSARGSLGKYHLITIASIVSLFFCENSPGKSGNRMKLGAPAFFLNSNTRTAPRIKVLKPPLVFRSTFLSDKTETKFSMR